MTKLQAKDLHTYTVHGLLAAGTRFSDDYDEEEAVKHYLELHPGADEAVVRAELAAAVIHSDSLIDSRISPYSSAEEIAAEIAEIERMPVSEARDATLKMMGRWLRKADLTKETPRGGR